MAMTAEKAAKRAKAAKKAKRHDQRGKDHPDAVAKADAIIERVKTATAEDHALGKQVKELRDGGMAWWQIAYQLNLPGSGPNVAQGKSGAARARALYKKTFGDLPGDVARRSTKASRAAGDGAPVVRKQVIPEELLADKFDTDAAMAEANMAILDLVDSKGHRARELRWIGKVQCSDGSTLESERSALVKPGTVVIRRELGRPTTISFQAVESHADHRSVGERHVRLSDVYDIRK